MSENPKIKHFFPPSTSTHPMEFRSHEHFQVLYANTERFKNSSTIYMQNILNNEIKRRKEQDTSELMWVLLPLYLPITVINSLSLLLHKRLKNRLLSTYSKRLWIFPWGYFFSSGYASCHTCSIVSLRQGLQQGNSLSSIHTPQVWHNAAEQCHLTRG